MDRVREAGKRRRLACRMALVALLLVGLSGAVCPAFAAEDLVWATGRVLDTDGKPLANALIAVYDDRNKVVDYTKTDENGEYALAVPRRVMHLDKQRSDFLTEVFSGVTRFVGGAAEFVSDPIRAGVRAITSRQAENTSNAVTRGGIAAGGTAVDQVLKMMTPRSRPQPTLQEERKMPGALVIKAVAPDRKDLIGVAKVYWMQQETFKAGGKQTRTVAAWLDPVQLAPVSASHSSTISSEYLHFASARLEPSIAEVGQRVRIVATLPAPPEPRIYPVVVARNHRTGQTWELEYVESGIYEGEIVIDKKFPRDDQTISILAYASKDTQPGRRKDVESALLGAGLWDAKKPFRYDPLLVVSRNRADLTLTVVASEKKR
jgi:hypothetical protein